MKKNMEENPFQSTVFLDEDCIEKENSYRWHKVINFANSSEFINAEEDMRNRVIEVGRRISIDSLADQSNKISKKKSLSYFLRMDFLLDLYWFMREILLGFWLFRIDRVPGFTTGRILGMFCSKKFRERELDALLADEATDYIEAVKCNDQMKIWVMRFRVPAAIAWTVFGGAVVRIIAICVGKTGTPKN